MAEPLSVTVFDYGTGDKTSAVRCPAFLTSVILLILVFLLLQIIFILRLVSLQELNEIVKKNFDLRPGRIVKDLKLKTPIFQQTASYGEPHPSTDVPTATTYHLLLLMFLC